MMAPEGEQSQTQQRLTARVRPGAPRTTIVVRGMRGIMPQPDYLIIESDGGKGEGMITAGYTDDGDFSGDTWAMNREQAIANATQVFGIPEEAWESLVDGVGSTVKTDRPHLACLREIANALLVRASVAMKRTRSLREEHQKSDLENGRRVAIGEALSMLETRAMLSLGSTAVVGLDHIDVQHEVLRADVPSEALLPDLARPSSAPPLIDADDTYCDVGLMRLCNEILERATDSRQTAEKEWATLFEHGWNAGYVEIVSVIDGCRRRFGLSRDDIGWDDSSLIGDMVAAHWWEPRSRTENETAPPLAKPGELYITPCCQAIATAFRLHPPIFMPQSALLIGRANTIGIAVYNTFDLESEAGETSFHLPGQRILHCPWCGHRILQARHFDPPQVLQHESSVGNLQSQILSWEQRATHAGVTVPVMNHTCVDLRLALAIEDLFLVAVPPDRLMIPLFNADVPGGSLRGDGIPIWYCPWDGALLGTVPPTSHDLPPPAPLPPGIVHPRS